MVRVTALSVPCQKLSVVQTGLHEKSDNLDRKMDFYLTTFLFDSTFPCFQIPWN